MTTNPGKLNFDFQEIYKKNYHAVLKQVRYITGDEAWAEDLVQEAFMKLYNAPPPDLQKIKNWLIKVAINIGYNHKRSEKRREKRELMFYEPFRAEQNDCANEVMASLEIELTRKALDSLSLKERSLLVLKFSGYSYQELSDILDINKSSVGTSIVRAQAKFREAYFRLAEGGK